MSMVIPRKDILSSPKVNVRGDNLLLNKNITIKIHSSNKKYYEELKETSLKVGQIIEVSQLEVSPKSHMKLECSCDLCGNEFLRARKDIKDITLCSKKCRNDYLLSKNPNPKIDKIEVVCCVCNKNILVFPSKFKKQEFFLCSRECYKQRRSEHYKGSKLYNYQNTVMECSNYDCRKPFKTSQWYIENKNSLFCSQECYWKHRKDNYLTHYYNSKLNKTRTETTPERIVRELLDKLNIKYVQEFAMESYFIDFYLPERDVALEVYGDYWHGNPEIYGEGLKDLNANQLKQINFDIKRNKKLKKHVSDLIILWEKDIKKCSSDELGHILLQKLDNINP